MWNPEKIKIVNLFAHKDSYYEFEKNTCTVIFGRNETDKGLENNGAGKSTLFEAICIALTGESLRAIRKENFINREEDSCEIDFTLTNPILKVELRIIRRFFRGGKSSQVEVWENGERNKEMTSVGEANKRIIELIGISREDLLRYYIISQDSHYTFFTASDAEKKEIMNRITSADMINPIIEELGMRLKEKQAEYNDIEYEITKVADRKELLLEQQEEVLKNSDTSKEKELILKRISDGTEEIKSLNSNIDKISNKIRGVNDEIKAFGRVENISELRSQLKEASGLYDKVNDEIREAKSIERKLKTELDGTIVCPNCNHEFVSDSEFDLTVAEIKKLLKETESLMELKAVKSNGVKEELNLIRKRVKEAEKRKDDFQELEDYKGSLTRQLKNKQADLSMINERVKKWGEDLKEVEQRKLDDKLLNSINAKVKSIDKEVKKYTDELIPLTEEIETIKFWQFNMGRSGFMTYLANQSVKIIEGMTNSFLKKFKVDISVLINGFTVLKSGEVREKIDVFIMNDGVTAESFMAKSGGERGRVMLAGILAIQNLINLASEGKGLNLLLFDECFHGMDSRGQENIIKIFEQIGITIMVITQNVSESFNNENTLFVVKENDVSRYI